MLDDPRWQITRRFQQAADRFLPPGLATDPLAFEGYLGQGCFSYNKIRRWGQVLPGEAGEGGLLL